MGWDMIVLTCLDKSQHESFKLQLQYWRSLRPQFKTVMFKIFHDKPPGAKIGAGGSTLNVMRELYEEYGESLYKYRILLLHAGGYSQRQPNASALGKVFSSIPRASLHKGNDCMLDLKLEMLNDLVQIMDPGVILASADDLEIIDLAGNNCRIQGQGFVLLGHISPLNVAVDHGVYILGSDVTAKIDSGLPFLQAVTQVLQKPSVELINLGCGVVCGASAVTDSCFYFSPKVIQIFVDIACKLGEITVEIDAYGDFLQPLGSQADMKYIEDHSRVIACAGDSEEQLVTARNLLFHGLHGLSAEALVIPNSRFVHIGTSKEMLYHFNKDHEFRAYFRLSNFVNATLIYDDKVVKWLTAENRPKNWGTNTCVVSCEIHHKSTIFDNCFIEYCSISHPIETVENCILSHCEFSSKVIFKRPIFMTIIPIILNEETKFVTIFTGTFDDVKTKSQIGELKMFDTRVADILSVLGMANCDMAKFGCVWDVSMFLAWDTVAECMHHSLSVLHDLGVVQYNVHETIALVKMPPLSIKQVMQKKDCKKLLHLRQKYL